MMFTIAMLDFLINSKQKVQVSMIVISLVFQVYSHKQKVFKKSSFKMDDEAI